MDHAFPVNIMLFENDNEENIGVGSGLLMGTVAIRFLPNECMVSERLTDLENFPLQKEVLLHNNAGQFLCFQEFCNRENAIV